jgi:hypothetical protein
MPLGRLELPFLAPEANALSTELQGRAKRFYHHMGQTQKGFYPCGEAFCRVYKEQNSRTMFESESAIPSAPVKSLHAVQAVPFRSAIFGVSPHFHFHPPDWKIAGVYEHIHHIAGRSEKS